MISPKRERGSTVSIGSTGSTGMIVAWAEQFLAVPAKWEKQKEFVFPQKGSPLLSGFATEGPVMSTDNCYGFLFSVSGWFL